MSLVKRINNKKINIECYKLILKKPLEKDDNLPSLNDVILDKTGDYVKALEQLFEYFSTSSGLLGVEKVYRQGDLIRPQFSGHRKKYEKPAIGLTFSILFYDKTRDSFTCSPLNAAEVSEYYKYSKVQFVALRPSLLEKSAWFIDLSQVYPFAVIRFFKILYIEDIKVFQILLNTLYGQYKDALNETLKHLKAPSKPTLSNTNKYVVMYRCQRTFASAVLTPKLLSHLFSTGIRKIILSNTIAYLITSDEGAAYYYSAILNYLVYKVAISGGGFILNQYGRPIKAIIEAGLKWVGEEWQQEVASLSKSIHDVARSIVLKQLGLPVTYPIFEIVDRERDIEVKNVLGEKVKDVLESLINNVEDARKMFDVIEENIDKDKLRNALRYVASFK